MASLTTVLSETESDQLHREATREAEIILVVETLCTGIETVDEKRALALQAGISAGIEGTLRILMEKGVLDLR